MNNSFTKQLNCIQSLQQIAPLYSAKDHLPKDIITILERLGKVDNTPFDKLYYLAENCADRYYTSVIKTFIEIIKWSTVDRQIILVNMARALKYLEDFGQRQSQFFTVLEKYHLLLESLANPPRTHSNTAIVSVQEQLTSPEPEVSDATNFQEEGTDRDPPDTTYNNLEESHGYDNFPQDIQNHTTEQHQITSGDSIDPEETPQLEEDWDNGQFADAHTNLINRYNTHSKSERIRREYSKHLLDLSDNQYYYKENPINQLQYSCPDPDYYGIPSRRPQTQLCDPNGYYPPPPDPVDVQHWHTCGRGKCVLLHGHRLFGEKTRSAESRKARNRRQNYKQ